MGLEEVLAGELQQLGLRDVQAGRGGVAFTAEKLDAWRACLHLRTANRVLQPIAEFPCQTSDELYAAVMELPWEELLGKGMTLAVDANLRDSQLTHSRFVALKTKDAVVDRLRDHTGWRPNIDPKSADLRINVHLAADHCTLSLDLAGASLHRRGYRHDPNLAPLRETLAAGLIALSDWEVESPFVDPMCGSGTLPLEAALMASRTPPGLVDPVYSFQSWPDFDAVGWTQIVEEARAACQPLLAGQIFGADRDPRILAKARRNAEGLPFGSQLTWQQSDFSRLRPPRASGTLICNPPYGQRLGEQEQLAPLYREIGDTLKQHWTGWTAWIFTGNLPLAKRIGLKPSRRIVLYNGPIECRLLKFELY